MEKKFRLLAAILLWQLCGLIFAQSGYVFTEELESQYASRAIYVCSDNSIVTLGNADFWSDMLDGSVAITKLDPLGNLVWRRFIHPGSVIQMTITGVDLDSTDKLTFVTSRNQQIILWEIDSDGVMTQLSEPIFNPAPPPASEISFNKALRTPDNEIVAVGNACYSLDLSFACYVRFSATGDILATAFWTADQGSSDCKAVAYDLILKDDANILVTCKLNNVSASILEIEPDGSVADRFNLPKERYSQIVPICKDPNNASFIVACRMGAPHNSLRIDRFENGVFETLFTIPNDYLFRAYSMMLGPDCIYMCGEIYPGTSGSLISMNYDGTLNWSWKQQGDNTCFYMLWGSPSPALLALDPDGCIYWAWGNYHHQVISKLLPNGQVPSDDDVQTPPVYKMVAYPNPMQSHLNIKIDQDAQQAGNSSIDIFNIRGQWLRSLEASNGEISWDGIDAKGKPCPPGIYLFRHDDNPRQMIKICKTH